MPSRVPRLERDLGRLHQLAERLFDLVRHEYDPHPTVTLHLENCDAVGDNPQCADSAVRILVVAQLLHYATREPADANPRYVIGFSTFVDELVAVLLMGEQPPSRATAQLLHEIRGEIVELCATLAMQATPGMPYFTDDSYFNDE